MFLSQKRAVNKLICPLLGIEFYVKICNLLTIDVTKGFLFRSLSKKKYILLPIRRVRYLYVKQLAFYFKERKWTLHGFLGGVAVSLALSRASLHEIMDRVGWKNRFWILEVLNSAGPAAKLASLNSAVLDVYTKSNELQEVSQAFCEL